VADSVDVRVVVVVGAGTGVTVVSVVEVSSRVSSAVPEFAQW
jgi:hypothetical protein